jgi:hypothetical protein
MQHQITGLFVNLPAEAVQPVPNTDFTQVVAKLPTTLTAGTYWMQIGAHGRFTSVATIRISGP